LIVLYHLNRNIKRTAERKKATWFKLWKLFCNLAPLLFLIISALVAKSIIQSGRRTGEYYAANLSIIGTVASGLDLVRMPAFKVPVGQMIIDVLPMAFIGFMESYSVANSIAGTKGELADLAPGQEMFATGFGNFLGSFFSAIPVTGSLGRSSLNLSAGGVTQLSGAVTTLIIVIALVAASDAFYWIPSAALSAIVFIAITNLVLISDFWIAFKHSKKDFYIMIATFFVTVVLDILTGLIVGVAMALLMELKEISFSSRNAPSKTTIASSQLLPSCDIFEGCSLDAITKDYDYGDLDCLGSSIADNTENEDGISTSVNKPMVKVVHANNNLSSLTMPRFKDFVTSLLLSAKRENTCMLVLDLLYTKHCDWTGLIELKEISDEAKHEGVDFIIVNTSVEVYAQIKKYGIKNHFIYDQMTHQQSVVNEAPSALEAEMTELAGDARDHGTGSPV